MPGLEWAFKLRDQVTQPAGSIESQLKRVAFALKTLDIAAKQTQLARVTDPLKKTRLELQLHRDKLMLSKRAIDEHAKSSRSWTDSIVKWAASTYIIRTIADGFREVGRAALEMGDRVKDAVETRQRGLFGLRATMGNRAGGNFFEQLERQAVAYGRPPGEVVASGAGFQTAGASPDLARKLVGAVYDVRAASGGKSDITQQLQAILTSPVLDVGNLTSFGGALDLKQLWASFGKRMGMRPGDAEQVLAKRIPGQFVAGGENSPLLQAVFDQLSGMPGGQGGVGNMARGFANNTLQGAGGRVSSAWDQLLGSADNTKGMKTLQDVLQNLAKTLGGQGMREGLRDLVDSLGKIIEPLQGAGGREKMKEFFDLIVRLAKDAAGAMGLLAKSFLGILQIAGVGSDVINIMKGTPPKTLTPETQALFSGLFGRPIQLADQSRQPFPFARQTPYQQFSQPVINVNVDNRGAGRALDPEGFRRVVQHELARQRQDAGPTQLNDGLEQLGIESGAQ